MLQRVAVCCSVLQCVLRLGAPSSMMKLLSSCVAMCCSVLQCSGSLFSDKVVVQLCCSVLHCVSVLQSVAVKGLLLQ